MHMILNICRARIRSKIQEIKDDINDTFVPGQPPSQLEFLLVVTMVIAASLNPCMFFSSLHILHPDTKCRYSSLGYHPCG
jgi:hypothetical protein